MYMRVPPTRLPDLWATLPKIGAIALLIRLAAFAGADRPDFVKVPMILFIFLHDNRQPVCPVQTDLKRLAAYSSIAHAGYIMIGHLHSAHLVFSSHILRCRLCPYECGSFLCNLPCGR